MAAAIEIQRMLDNGSEYIPSNTTVTKNDTKFDEVFQKEILVQNTKQSFTKLTDNSDVQSMAESLVKAALSGDESGLQALKTQFDGFSDNMTRVEVLSILQQIISYAMNENAEVCPSGKTQDFINRLFYAGKTSGAVQNTATNAKIDEILQALKPSADDSDEKTKTNTDLLSQLAALLQQMNTSSQTANPQIYQANTDAVGMIDGTGTYSIPHKELAARLMEIVSVLVDKPTSEIFPNYDSVSKTVSAAVSGSSLSFGSGKLSEQQLIDSAPKSADNSVYSDMVKSFSANTSKAMEYGAVANNPQTSKLMAESEILKLSALSKRVQKTGEIDELTSLLSSQTTLPNREISLDDVTSKLSEFPLEEQILPELSERIKSSVSGTSSEMTMRLNPENLGEINVKISNEAGKITVTVAAQSEITQKILQERLPLLVQNLQNTNSDVKVVNVTSSNTAYMDYMGQSNTNSQNSSSGQTYHSAGNSSSEMESDEVNSVLEKGVNRLWQTA